MKQEMVHAPAFPVVRRNVGVLLVVGVGLILGSRWFFFPWLRTYLSAATGIEAFHRFQYVMAGFCALLLSVALWMFSIGLRVFRAQQIPLAGTFVIRDTPIRRGREARMRGVLFMALSTLLAVLGVIALFIPQLPIHH